MKTGLYELRVNSDTVAKKWPATGTHVQASERVQGELLPDLRFIQVEALIPAHQI